jgi:hypothetical protein
VTISDDEPLAAEGAMQSDPSAADASATDTTDASDENSAKQHELAVRAGPRGNRARGASDRDQGGFAGREHNLDVTADEELERSSHQHSIEVVIPKVPTNAREEYVTVQSDIVERIIAEEPQGDDGIVQYSIEFTDGREERVSWLFLRHAHAGNHHSSLTLSPLYLASRLEFPLFSNLNAIQAAFSRVPIYPNPKPNTTQLSEHREHPSSLLPLGLNLPSVLSSLPTPKLFPSTPSKPQYRAPHHKSLPAAPAPALSLSFSTVDLALRCTSSSFVSQRTVSSPSPTLCWRNPIPNLCLPCGLGN